MCICVHCYYVDQCETYHAVEHQHQQPHRAELLRVAHAVHESDGGGEQCLHKGLRRMVSNGIDG